MDRTEKFTAHFKDHPVNKLKDWLTLFQLAAKSEAGAKTVLTHFSKVDSRFKQITPKIMHSDAPSLCALC